MGVSIERELSDLDKGITTLRVDYERFFGGELKTPPLPARRAIEATLRRLGNSDIEKAVERFRLQSLQSRFNAFAELWEKRLQVREEGRPSPSRRAAALSVSAGPSSAPPARTASAPAGPADVAVLLAAAEAAAGRRAPAPGSAPPRDASAPPSVKPRSRVDFTPLFRRYVEARKALGEDVSRMKYERFEEAVKRQAEEIRRKTGSSRLVFEVQTTDGRVRLVGRPAGPGSKG